MLWDINDNLVKDYTVVEETARIEAEEVGN